MKLDNRTTRSERWISCLLVFFLIILGYSSAVQFDFINYDDPEYITSNERVNTGLSLVNTKWAMTSVGKMNLWHPLTYLSHQLDVTLYGLDPMGHHAMNILLHALGGVFLYLFIAHLTKSKLLPFVIVAIWAFHPQRVQSVAWLSERKDVLSGMFLFLTLYSYTKWLAGKTEWYYWLSIASCSLALLSKPSVVTVPIILIGIYYLFNYERMSRRALIARLMPFFILAVSTAIVTMYFQSKGGLSNLTNNIGTIDYFAKILLSFSFYIERLFNPTPHQLWFYPDLTAKRMIIAGAVSLVSILVVIFTYRKSKYISFGAIWYCIMWLPVSGVIPLSFYYRADRYSYLPQIGIILVLVGWGMLVVKKWQLVSKLTIPISVIVIVTLALVQQSHLQYWKNNQTLFKHEMTINPRSLLAPIHYGHSIEKEHPLLALEYYTRAHEIDRESGLALTNMGVICEQQGMIDEAIENYTMATKTAVQDHTPWVRLIDLLIRESKPEGVEEYIQQALKLYPTSEEVMLVAAHYFYAVKEDADAALFYYRKLYGMRPSGIEFVRDYAIIAYKAGYVKEAKDLFITLPAAEKDHPVIRVILNE